MKKLSNKPLTKTPLRQYEVAVCAVYLLDGTSKSIDTEDIAVECHRLAPLLFSWQKYKEHPNLELVRVGLSDAKKTKNGGLLAGSGREGWRLTARGMDWIANRNRGELQKLTTEFNDKTSGSRAGSIDSVRKRRERDHLISSRAYEDWADRKVPSMRDLQHTLRINEYTTQKMLEMKIPRLRAMFEGDAEISQFLKVAEKVLLKENHDA